MSQWLSRPTLAGSRRLAEIVGGGGVLGADPSE